MSSLSTEAENRHGLRNGNKVVVPRFYTVFMKHSTAHRGSIIWNALSHKNVNISNLRSFCHTGRSKNILKINIYRHVSQSLRVLWLGRVGCLAQFVVAADAVSKSTKLMH